MNLFQYFQVCVTKKYGDFSGRARRMEFGSFFLIYSLLLIFIAQIDAIIFGENYFIFFTLFFLATLIPQLSVTIRRFHDTNNSGWLFLLTIIPCFGSIILLIFGLLDSYPDTNKWGPNPKGPHNNTDDWIEHLVD